MHEHTLDLLEFHANLHVSPHEKGLEVDFLAAHPGLTASRDGMELTRPETLTRRCLDALPEVKKVVAGGIAGCISKTCVAPLSRVTVLMQVQSMRPHKFTDGVHPNNQCALRA